MATNDGKSDESSWLEGSAEGGGVNTLHGGDIARRSSPESSGELIRPKRIYNFCFSMLVFTPFS
jgi:hypothetical protein